MSETTSSRVIAAIERHRAERGWSVATLASRCREAGHDITEASLVNLLTPSRARRITLDALDALAAGLNITPFAIIFDGDGGEDEGLRAFGNELEKRVRANIAQQILREPSWVQVKP